MFKRYFCFSVILAITMGACSNASTPATTSTPIPLPTALIQVYTPTGKIPLPTASPIPEEMIYSKAGRYFAGKMAVKYPHPWLPGKELNLTIFYPAVRPPDYTGTVNWDVQPDSTGAPYTTLLCSTTMANEFAPSIVSHGFVVVSVDGQGPYEVMDSRIIDYPQQILAALDNVVTKAPVELQGMLQTERVGVFGYSFDGYNSLALSGARFDPQYHRERCADLVAHPESITPAPENWWLKYMCPDNLDYVRIAGEAGKRLSVEADGLGQAMTDDRIKAAAPMAPDGALWFGERGLMEVKMPILLIGGTMDNITPYKVESVPIYEMVGSRDKTLISFIGREHMMIYNAKEKAEITHFLVAFFKHQLEGSEADARYYSKEFVNSQPGLFWGPYTQ